jgi:DEAD/DEAH box helicase
MRHDALDAARNLLRNTFGHADFRGLQAGVIGEVLAGRSALAVLPTGGGKSLCYQIPSLVRPGLGLVVSPLIALMADQVAALQQSGVAAEKLDSNTGLDARRHLAADRRGGAGPALPVARRPDAALDARAPGARAACAGGHRRGPLRQPMGPRLPPRIPDARPFGGDIPSKCRAWRSLPRQMPARVKTSATSYASLTRWNSSTALRARSSPYRQNASAAKVTGACSNWWPSGRSGPG